MTEQEAKIECKRLAAEHPDRATHQWLPTRLDSGEWAVAKINVPPPVKPSGTETRSEPRPNPDDPRENFPWLNPPSGGIT
jgi:hypothetical protein